jgi:hypothetical protein
MNKLYVWLFTVSRKKVFVFYHREHKERKERKMKNLTARELFSLRSPDRRNLIPAFPHSRIHAFSFPATTDICPYCGFSKKAVQL